MAPVAPWRLAPEPEYQHLGDLGEAQQQAESTVHHVGRLEPELDGKLDLILACEGSKTERAVQAEEGGDGGCRDGVRGHHGLTGSDGRSYRRDPRHARAESWNRGGDGVGERTPGRKRNTGTGVVDGGGGRLSTQQPLCQAHQLWGAARPATGCRLQAMEAGGLQRQLLRLLGVAGGGAAGKVAREAMAATRLCRPQ
ncbi:unnamed protein product [Miscanthus lutarioriparius]|uniref:Uncharacterized protein n=1 Tax=Miscanthus lutarioriparius TaxID=422564 RepID=A0A811MTW8_9POAL|nr:unnamed protein product [Miscanthus lutarioriparius]